MDDLLIRNALLLDGSGTPAARGHLCVKDGRIASVGEAAGAARETIDADGLALMPGIIDNHTHYDAQITWDPAVTPSPALGVTTAIIGNCGFTIAPCRPADRELVMRNLTQVEGMSLDALRQGIRWEFESVPEYLALLERQGSAVNVACFVGHSSVRTYVMGDDAPRRAATAAEVARMRELVLEGLRALVGTLKEAGRGLFMLTKGGQTKIAFLEELAAESGRPVVIAALLHNSTNPRAVFADLDAITEANGRGRKLVGAMSCCPLSFDFTMQSPYPVEGLDAWKPALGLKGAALKAKLADPAFRQSIRDELSRPAVFRLFNGEWDKVQVVETAKPGNARFEQRTLADLARETGKDPLDVWFDLAVDEDLATVFVALTLNSDEAAVGEMLRHPASMVSLSDAGAHLTFFNDAGFGLHLLGHWSRDLGVLSLEDAARRLTGHPASVFGIRERGLLKAGYCADLLLFDPATVNRGPKSRVFDLPGGHPRLTTPAIGVHGVWVNGVRIADAEGMLPSGRRPGSLLRDCAA